MSVEGVSICDSMYEVGRDIDTPWSFDAYLQRSDIWILIGLLGLEDGAVIWLYINRI